MTDPTTNAKAMSDTIPTLETASPDQLAEVLLQSLDDRQEDKALANALDQWMLSRIRSRLRQRQSSS